MNYILDCIPDRFLTVCGAVVAGVFLTVAAPDAAAQKNEPDAAVQGGPAAPVTNAAPPVVRLSKPRISMMEGGSDSYTAVLVDQPADTVTVTITGHEDTGVTVQPVTLTFTPGDWNTAQTVTLAAAEDDDAADEWLTLIHTGSGAAFSTDAVVELDVRVHDDDYAGVILSTDTLTVPEGGADTFTVVLESRPTADVTVSIRGEGDVTVEPADLIFTPGDWRRTRTVTVTAGQDPDVVDDEAVLTVDLSSDDVEYDWSGGALVYVTVTVADDEPPTPGVFLGDTDIRLIEGRPGRLYPMRLNTRPAAEVTVTIAGYAGTSVTLDRVMVTFTSDDWDIEQWVTVTPAEDANGVSEQLTLTHSTASADGDYDGLAVESVAVTVTDDDTPGVTLSDAALRVTEGGGAASYTVVLDTEPAAEVTVTIAGHAGTAVTVEPATLTFSAEDWDVEQTVTVTPAGRLDAASESVTLTHTAASAGGDYDGVAIGSVAVTVTNPPPTTATPIADRTLTAGGAAVEVTVSAAFSDHGSLTYSATSSDPDVAAVSVSGDVVTVTPVAAGTATVTVTAADSGGGTAVQTFVVTVEAEGPPPDLMPSFGDATVADVSYLVGVPIPPLTLPAATGGDAPLAYALAPALPEGLVFDAATRTLTGTPATPLEPAAFTLTATDADGDGAELSFTVSVEEAVAAGPGETVEVGGGMIENRLAAGTIRVRSAGDGATLVVEVENPGGADDGAMVAVPLGAGLRVGTVAGDHDARAPEAAPRGYAALAPDDPLIDVIADARAEICLPAGERSGAPALFHYRENEWRKIGDRRRDGLVCGEIAHFSPLAVFYRKVSSAPPARVAERWLARFGGTVTDHVMEAIGARLVEDARGNRMTLAGRNVAPAGDAGLYAVRAAGPLRRPGWNAAGPLRWPRWSPGSTIAARRGGSGPGGPFGVSALEPRGVSGAAILAGSSFRLSPADRVSGGWTAWGRARTARFDENGGGTSLDGDVGTGAIGVDYDTGRVVAGLALAHSRGEGEFAAAASTDTPAVSGDVDSSLTSLHPYLRVAVADRLSAWGVLGYGWGETEMEHRSGIGTGREKADFRLVMAGAGARGALLRPKPAGGFALSARAEAFTSRVKAEDGGTAALAGVTADRYRARLALEGSYESESPLRPSLEVGLRHDGGDGETGLGVEVGGGLAWSGPAGLSAEARLRALLTGGDVREWGAGGSLLYAPGAAGRGLSLAVAPSWGAADSGIDRLWERSGAVLSANDSPRVSRLEAEAGYGVAVMGGSALLTPHAGLALSGADDTRYRVGARLSLGPAASLDLTGTRRETRTEPEHAVTLRARLRW